MEFGESYSMTKHMTAMVLPSEGSRPERRALPAWRTLAVARAGSSGSATSQGSRGSRTYSNDGAAPMQRSLTPTPSPSQPSLAPRPSPLAPAYGGGFMQQHPFMSGLMGGFIGAGLAGMLFGHSAYAADGSGVGSMLGLLLQFALIGGLIWLAVSFFRRRSPLATAPGMYPMAATAMPAA